MVIQSNDSPDSPLRGGVNRIMRNRNRIKNRITGKPFCARLSGGSRKTRIPTESQAESVTESLSCACMLTCTDESGSRER